MRPPRSHPPLRRAACLGGLCAAALALFASEGRADDVRGTRSEKLQERSHRIDLRLDRGHAALTVRRTVWNGGARHDQATFMIDLPAGAVATGLRTLGYRDAQPSWFDGELLEAEAAAAKYQELTGLGGYYPKDPALLSWRSQDRLALQVFPCAPGQPKTVEYTLKMPTEYREGRHHLVLPRMGTERLAAELTVTAAQPGDGLFLDGKPVAAGTSVTLDKETTDIALAPRAPGAIEGALASVPFDDDRVLVELRVDAAARLTEPPRNAHVVVLVDASRSIGQRDGAAAIAAARAMLAHLPDAKVEVLTFDREVRALHGRFVPAATADASLAVLALSRRNGSRIDDALARADALLAKAPRGAPRRILALTDLRTRSRLTPSVVGAAVKSGALVHVGVVGEGEPSLERDDESPWAAPVRATGGLVWQGGASIAPIAAEPMAKVYEEWARPTRLHKLVVRAKGIEEALFADRTELHEGEGLEEHRVHDEAVRELSVQGELWARPFRETMSPDEAHGRLWSALVFGSDLLGSIDEPAMMVLAMRGRAVSPVTSYLAIEPGVRPSTEGLEEGEGLGLSGIGEGGGGRGEGIGLGSIGGIDPRGWLASALGPHLARCAPTARSARVTLETTLREVVDVTGVSIAGSGADGAAESRCLEEAVWDLMLPSAFTSPEASYAIDLEA